MRISDSAASMLAKTTPEQVPTANVKAAPVDAIKSIPPEDSETITAKSWTIASFWAVVIFLGLPVWLWTTSIHRANLPSQEMLKWADGKACELNFPIYFDIDASSLSSIKADAILVAAKSAVSGIHVYQPEWNLTAAGQEPIHDGQNVEFGQKVRVGRESLLIRPQEAQGLSRPMAQLLPDSEIIEVYYDGSLLETNTAATANAIGSAISQEVMRIFSEEQSAIRHVLESIPSMDQQRSTGATTNTANKRGRVLKYAPNIHISISLFTPEAVPKTWAIDEAVDEYFKPLLDSFSISNFTVDTQLQLYAPFSPSMKQPEFDSENKQWTVREEDLSSFVNPTDWPLSPSIGDGPTLNFILYIPEESQRPLVVKDSSAHSWIVPQWGGVSILNPTERIPSHLTKEYLQTPILVFSRQLLSLLGAPETPLSFDFQLQALTRIHALSLMLSASSTLGSLARLSESLATIPIPEEVLLRVQRGLDHLQSTCNELKAGRPKQALEYAKLAEAEAEKAFFEKDMVSQVYFPDEHKVAVYLPLLGPIGVPLVTSLIRAIRRRRAARK